MTDADCAAVSSLFTPGAVDPWACCHLFPGIANIQCNSEGRISSLEFLNEVAAGVSIKPDAVQSGSAFSQLTALEALKLANANLNAFPGNLATLPNLKTLDLSKNNIKTVPDLSRFPQLGNINLQGNPVTGPIELPASISQCNVPSGVCASGPGKCGNLAPCSPTSSTSATTTTTSTSTSTSSTTTSASATATATTTTSTAATASPTSRAESSLAEPNNGISAGAWAGIGVAIALSILAIAAALFVYRRRQQQQKGKQLRSAEDGTAGASGAANVMRRSSGNMRSSGAVNPMAAAALAAECPPSDLHDQPEERTSRAALVPRDSSVRSLSPIRRAGSPPLAAAVLDTAPRPSVSSFRSKRSFMGGSGRPSLSNGRPSLSNAAALTISTPTPTPAVPLPVPNTAASLKRQPRRPSVDANSAVAESLVSGAGRSGAATSTLISLVQPAGVLLDARFTDIVLRPPSGFKPTGGAMTASRRMRAGHEWDAIFTAVQSRVARSLRTASTAPTSAMPLDPVAACAERVWTDLVAEAAKGLGAHSPTEIHASEERTARKAALMHAVVEALVPMLADLTTAPRIVDAARELGAPAPAVLAVLTAAATPSLLPANASAVSTAHDAASTVAEENGNDLDPAAIQHLVPAWADDVRTRARDAYQDLAERIGLTENVVPASVAAGFRDMFVTSAVRWARVVAANPGASLVDVRPGAPLDSRWMDGAINQNASLSAFDRVLFTYFPALVEPSDAGIATVKIVRAARVWLDEQSGAGGVPAGIMMMQVGSSTSLGAVH
ncbi:hypothetical protein AMAG_14043 [Allomyces macrogynus ATCC 38327]|uniref:Leucine-rich repeat-containing N-terminal plant-type domain-containing protein n=1 Tax=Allomyces macrogynus (strain ATCC 38327) TaxID=578462 RepID=A0A0L0T3V0_ALLM3|nr:hypothetical protein AMAG_14043 [Allomyces macrogynus ATCC 38327]|eukprot:KNE69473.1 hypothetical protein AMAG_14043 [Allomyces macrogynus ATCC 38327]